MRFSPRLLGSQLAAWRRAPGTLYWGDPEVGMWPGYVGKPKTSDPEERKVINVMYRSQQQIDRPPCPMHWTPGMVPPGFNPIYRMPGTTFSSLGESYSLIPLFVVVGAGCVAAFCYVLRLALQSPDVSWRKGVNPEPWNKIEPTYQYKFHSPNVDYSKLKKNRPDF